jgi:predicted esterase
MSGYLKRARSKRIGIGLAAAAVLVVGGWRLAVLFKPDRVQAVAAELGSIGQYKDELYPNKAGTRLVYTEDVETGAGLFFSEIPGGKTKQLCELNENDFDWQRFGMLGWSTDDSYFVYALPPNKASKTDNLVICDGKTGVAITNVPAPANLESLAWLSPQSFAYLTQYYQIIKVVERKGDGRWVETHDLGQVYSGKESARNLIATSPTSVAWIDGTNIWTLDINASGPQMVWKGISGKLLGLGYSTEKGEFLLNCSDGIGQFLMRYNPATRWESDPVRLGDRLHPIQNLNWENGRANYAYRENDRGTNFFTMKTDATSKLMRLPWPGAVRTFTFNGNFLYIAGSVGADPAGIYYYDLQSEIVRPIVSSLKQPLRYAHCVEPVDGVFTNESGNLASYHVWRPANILPDKKYPIILCQTPYIWTPFPQIAANAGYIYAWVDRPSWFEGLNHWHDDVMGLYRVMAKDRNVDTERVFLYGASAETAYSARLIQENPELWRGVIYFSPVVPPPLSETKMSSMLFVLGQDEGDTVIQKWKKYQNDAAGQGIRVSLDFESGAKHISRSISTERDRARQLAKFLVEN